MMFSVEMIGILDFIIVVIWWLKNVMFFGEILLLVVLNSGLGFGLIVFGVMFWWCSLVCSRFVFFVVCFFFIFIFCLFVFF